MSKTKRGLWAAAAISGTYLLARIAQLRQQQPIATDNTSASQRKLSGLRKPVEILRDRWGVPHIYAQTEVDLFFAQGFVHAQDRLFQLDLNRRVGAGRLSEIVGSKALQSDRFARYLGWGKAAAAQVEGADPESRALAEAYAAGVNAFIENGRLPSEFRLLAYKPEPWTVYDSAYWGVVLAWGLAANWESDLMRAQLIAAIGAEKTADLLPGHPPDGATILDSADLNSRIALEIGKVYQEAMLDSPVIKMPLGQGMGSNNWVVNGSHTASGRPILANDPHLPPIFPAIWYENHLAGGRYHVTGFSTPGVPGILIGHNDKVAWGITNAFPDVQDLYLEQFDPEDKTLVRHNGFWQSVDIVTETIKVRGRKQPVVETVRYTKHGPVISDILPDCPQPMALRWAAHDLNNHMRAILETNRAQDWSSFYAGVQHWGFPSQNIVYADTDGHIGYVMPGMIPRRAKGNGALPVPGWINDYEWQGYIPHAELPMAVNPKAGLIVTANNRVVDDSYSHHLTADWLAPYRAARIQELLQDCPQQTLADHARIQQDQVSLLARRFLPLILPHLMRHIPHPGVAMDALAQLQAWDYEMGTDSIAATLYFGTLVHLTQAVLTQAVGAELTAVLLAKRKKSDVAGKPFHRLGYELVVRWLENGAPDWVGDMRPLIVPAFLQTIDRLQQTQGDDPSAWQWGQLHQLQIKHPLARIPGIGKLWRPQTFAVGGDTQTVNQTDVSPHFPPDPVQLIASCRLIFDVGAWDNSLAVIPGGQSASPRSPHYQDGLDDWINGRYHPLLFSRERVETAVVHTTTLAPTENPGLS